MNIFRIILKSVLVVVIFIAIIFAVPIVLNFFYPDRATVDDSTLELSIVTVADDDNAYSDLVKAAKAYREAPPMDDDTTEQINGILVGITPWDAELVQKVLIENKEALAYFSTAARKKAYQNPALVDLSIAGPDTIMPDLAAWRYLAQLSALESLSLAREGKAAESLGTALNPIIIGEVVERSQKTFMEYLIATEMKKTGLRALEQISRMDTFSISDKGLYYPIVRDVLKESISDGVDAASALKVMYFVDFLPIVDMLKAGTGSLSDMLGIGFNYGDGKITWWERFPLMPFYFHPNDTKQRFVEDITAGMLAVQAPCDTAKVAIPPYQEEDPISAGKLWRMYITPNSTGEYLYNMFKPQSLYTGLQTKRCEVNAQIRLVENNLR